MQKLIVPSVELNNNSEISYNLKPKNSKGVLFENGYAVIFQDVTGIVAVKHCKSKAAADAYELAEVAPHVWDFNS